MVMAYIWILVVVLKLENNRLKRKEKPKIYLFKLSNSIILTRQFYITTSFTKDL